MNLTRRSVLQTCGAGVAAGVAGCLSEPGDDSGSNGDQPSSGYAAFFILWDWARAIGGDALSFQNTLSVGEAGHGWNPPSDLVLDVAETDAFVYLDSPEFAWAQDVAAQLEEEDVATIDVMSAVDSQQLLMISDGHDHGEEGDDHEEGDGHDHSEGGGNAGDAFVDPHMWVDPVIAGEMVGWLGDELADLDPENAEQYRENADAYVEQLNAVDEQFRGVSEEARLDVAVFAGHDSFRYVERRYDFRLHSPQGVAPQAEPSPDDIAETIELVEDNGIDTILYDPLETPDGSPPPLAERILDSTDAAEARPLTSGDGTTAEWRENGWGWVEQMEEVNLPSLRAALDA